MNEFLKSIKDNVLIYDGSKGYLLQKLGLKGGECAEEWNITKSEKVKEVYQSYKDAGSDVIQTNTFPGNRHQLEKYGLGEKTYEINYEGARLAKEVMGARGFVAASIGPTGLLFEPAGELTFDQAYQIFKEQVVALAEGGVDIINFETFTDLAEMRAALLAAKENTDLPVVCSISFEANGKTLMGTDPFTAAVVLKSLGADMIGTNCSLGPDHILGIIREMSKTGAYLSVKPNAGLPDVIDGETVYRDQICEFSTLAMDYVDCGVRLIGGCCGTTPELVSALKEKLAEVEAPRLKSRAGLLITSGTKALELEQDGNREGLSLKKGSISGDNPDLLTALKENDLDFVTDIALELASEDYDLIYVNIESAGVDRTLLSKVVNEAQGYIKEPFIMDTSDHEALEQALRIYKGKAGVIVEGYDEKVIEQLLRVAKKYGSTVVSRKIIE